MSDNNKYTRVQTTEANPEKSGWYDTDRGRAFYDVQWRRRSPQYWYKLVEEPELTFTCVDCGQKLTEVRPGSYQCDNENCIQNFIPEQHGM